MGDTFEPKEAPTPEKPLSDSLFDIADSMEETASRVSPVSRGAAERTFIGVCIAIASLITRSPGAFKEGMEALLTLHPLATKLFSREFLSSVAEVYAKTGPEALEAAAATPVAKHAINTLVSGPEHTKQMINQRLPWSTFVLPKLAEIVRALANSASKMRK